MNSKATLWINQENYFPHENNSVLGICQEDTYHILLSKRITSLPLKLLRGAFIYFLFEGDEIVYVGQSNNLIIRIAEHLKSGKNITSVAFLEFISKDDSRFHPLAEIEKYFIFMFKPKLNKQFLEGLSKITIKEVLL